MAWAGEKKLAFDWSYYLWVYVWLRQSPFKERLLADDKYLRSIMGASAARWAMLDRGRDCGIVIGCVDTTDLVIGWKCRSVRLGREIELIEPEEPLPAPPDIFGYFPLQTFELDVFPGWQSLGAMTSAPLWRGYWLLFASTSAAAFIMQIDLAMVARLGGRASGAYAILMRDHAA